MGIEPTNPKANWIELSVICGLFVVLAVVGIIWDIASGLLTSGIDGIMMLAICLMMGGIFSLMILMMVHQAGLLPFFRPSATKAPSQQRKKRQPRALRRQHQRHPKLATAVPVTSPAAAPPLQPSHPPAVLQPPPPPPPPAAPKPAAKPAPAEPPKPDGKLNLRTSLTLIGASAASTIVSPLLRAFLYTNCEWQKPQNLKLPSVAVGLLESWRSLFSSC